MYLRYNDAEQDETQKDTWVSVLKVNNYSKSRRARVVPTRIIPQGSLMALVIFNRK